MAKYHAAATASVPDGACSEQSQVASGGEQVCGRHERRSRVGILGTLRALARVTFSVARQVYQVYL